MARCKLEEFLCVTHMSGSLIWETNLQAWVQSWVHNGDNWELNFLDLDLHPHYESILVVGAFDT